MKIDLLHSDTYVMQQLLMNANKNTHDFQYLFFQIAK